LAPKTLPWTGEEDGLTMEQFLGYAVPGIPYGCVYAIVAVGLVLTYQTTGVFNFAFGAQAFMSAYVFAILTQNENFPVWAAFLLSVVVLAPALGLLLDRFLFRRNPEYQYDRQADHRAHASCRNPGAVASTPWQL
jgi:branched-subunit amino acid ABC-type transport system permease component